MLLIDYLQLFDRLLILDVNAPRDEIEELRDGVDEEEVVLFQVNDVNTHPKQPQALNHHSGHVLDICLLKLLKFLDDKFHPLNCSADQGLANRRFFKMLIQIFDEVLLPSHNTHHVQFVVFHVCSFHVAYSDAFLRSLWLKVQNPKVSSIIRHVAVSYIASFLARAKIVPLR